MKCLSITNTNNVGDLMCNPSLYYPLGKLDNIDDCKGNLKTPIIYGGGAIASRAIRHARLQSDKTIFWGGGHTVRNKDKHPIPDYSVFDLYGTRDYGNGRWVPCVSCKSYLFDKEYDVVYDIIVYGHRAVKSFNTDLPYLDNEHNSFEDVIKFLGSGKRVITSSYHGVYWATLLGKDVICVPFGSKFHYFKHKPSYANSISEALCAMAFNYPSALQDCRKANDEFYSDVLKVI